MAAAIGAEDAVALAAADPVNVVIDLSSPQSQRDEGNADVESVEEEEQQVEDGVDEDERSDWYVLVGGEAYESHGKPAGRDLMHTSLTYVAQAYSKLRAAGVPRSRIVTIVQLHDYLNSLGGMPDTAYPKTMYLKECAELLRDGGADYDFRTCLLYTSDAADE